jgi:hypothetical protein
MRSKAFRKAIVVGLALAFTGSAWLGCSKVKVDCEKVCKRTFDECLEDVLVASGKLSKEKLDMAKKAGMLKKMKKQGYDTCLKNCKDQKGLGSDAGDINKCLKKKSCKEYADCIKGHLK